MTFSQLDAKLVISHFPCPSAGNMYLREHSQFQLSLHEFILQDFPLIIFGRFEIMTSEPKIQKELNPSG